MVPDAVLVIEWESVVTAVHKFQMESEINDVFVKIEAKAKV